MSQKEICCPFCGSSYINNEGKATFTFTIRDDKLTLECPRCKKLFPGYLKGNIENGELMPDPKYIADNKSSLDNRGCYYEVKFERVTPLGGVKKDEFGNLHQMASVEKRKVRCCLTRKESLFVKCSGFLMILFGFVFPAWLAVLSYHSGAEHMAVAFVFVIPCGLTIAIITFLERKIFFKRVPPEVKIGRDWSIVPGSIKKL